MPEKPIDENMVKRVAFAIVAIPALIGIVWFGDWALVALLVVAATIGIGELFHLAELAGTRPLLELGRVLAALAPVAVILMMKVPDVEWVGANIGYSCIGLMLIVVCAVVFSRTPLQRPLASIAITLFGVVYTAVLPSTMLLIRHGNWGTRSTAGTALVLFPLIVTWVTDTAAMIGGQKIGGPKMAPMVSPGKTQAGGIAGVIGGTVIGALYAWFVFPRMAIDVGVVAAAALALVLSIVGQIGDLAESLFKREAGVKDSSALIPGHGGVLDRLDSLYLAIPAAAIGFHILGVI
jgi:phosphatidate cytidylyltransferase